MQKAKKTYLYDAFISYSRKDNAFVEILERTLENYKPPKNLDVPQGYLNIFHDVYDMTGTEYFQAIEEHLKNSAKLIVVCSRNARQSKLVNDEIRRFAKINGAENIISIIINGIPNNLAKAGQEDDLAFPEALCEIKEMPIAKEYDNFNPQKDKINKGNYENAWYQLLADIYDTTPRRMAQIEEKRKQRRRKITTGIVSGVMMSLMALTAFALIQRYTAIKERKRAENFSLEVQKSAKIIQKERDRAISEKDRADENASEAERQRRIADTRRIEAERLSNIALARQLAAQSQLVIGQRAGLLQRSVLLATESLKRHVTIEGLQTLSNGLSKLRRLVGQLSVQGNADDFVFSYDAKKLFMPQGKSLTIWDVNTWQEIESISLSEDLRTLALSADGKWLATASRKIVRIWDVVTWQEIATMQHEKDVHACAFNLKGNSLVTGCGDLTVGNGEVRLWDIKTSEVEWKVEFKNPVLTVAFSPNGKWLAVGGGEIQGNSGELRVWESLTHQLYVDMDTKYTVNTVTFSPDGEKLALGNGNFVSGGGELWLIDFATKKGNRYSFEKSVWDIDFSSDGKLLALGMLDKTVRILESESMKEKARIYVGELVFKVAFSPDNEFLVTGSGSSAQVWQVSNTFDVFLKVGVEKLFDIAISNDGRSIATAGGNIASVWDITSGQEISRFTLDEAKSVDLSYDGKYLATGGNSGIQVWEVIARKKIAQFEHADEVTSVALSSDGNTLVSVGRNSLVAWKVTTHREICNVSYEKIDNAFSENDLLFYDSKISPDEKLIAIGGADVIFRRGLVFIIEIATGRKLTKISVDRPIYSLAFSPNGQWLAGGSAELEGSPLERRPGEARVWETLTGREISQMAYEQSVVSLAFSMDGKFLATGSGEPLTNNGRACVWEISSGSEIAHILHKGFVDAISFSHDGRRIVMGSGNNVRSSLWQPKDLIDEVCSYLRRNLTFEEWQKYLGDIPYQKTCANLPLPEKSIFSKYSNPIK